MNPIHRIIRYARISWKNLAVGRVQSPPILVLFINSVCNLRCDHCCYWKSLNQKDDLSVDEILELAKQMGRLEILAISGGEPFLREGFSRICRFFVRNNRAEQIYVPTNAYYTDRIIKSAEEVLEEKDLKLFCIEISLDGLREYHNRFRGSVNSFEKAMETYDALVELQKKDQRLRIHSVSTATADNLEEIARLTTFLYSRCPEMDHHNIALIRGDRKNPDLRVPGLDDYNRLHEYVQRLWAPREEGRYGSIVEPMLKWAKVQTLKEGRQVIPCRAGVLSAVVYANGDVGICESHPPLGNLRQKGFMEIWRSDEMNRLRRYIRDKQCFCSNEIFLWPSIVFQPLHMINAMVRARAWRRPEALKEDEGSLEPSLIDLKREKN